MPVIRVQQQDFDPGALQEELYQRCAGQAGAIASFTGYVRDYAPGQPTDALFLEHYPGMCERELEDIAAQAMQRWRLLDCLVLHRVGELPRHARIVHVAAASAHRGDAFQACEFIMDQLKTRAPFWKRERLADGRSFWVEARSADDAKSAAWQAATPPTSSQDQS